MFFVHVGVVVCFLDIVVDVDCDVDVGVVYVVVDVGVDGALGVGVDDDVDVGGDGDDVFDVVVVAGIYIDANNGFHALVYVGVDVVADLGCPNSF